MANIEIINSDTYWDARFAENWDACKGPGQSRFFALLAIEHLPQWLIKQLQLQMLTLADWGCAQGDGADVWASYIDAKQIAGVDFSSVAIEQAAQRYPAIRFINADWLTPNGDPGEDFDVVFSSNTLEHFHKPYDALNTICFRAKKAIVLALPYKELDRIDEHFFSFLPENIPLQLANGFRLIWSRVVDCQPLPNSHWNGDQIILVYADFNWVDSLGLKLRDHSIEQSDTTAENVRLNAILDEREGQITSLNQAVIERDKQISCLNQAVTEREGQIVSLNQAVIKRDKQISCLNQAATEREGQVVSLNQAVIERDKQISCLNQAVTEREGQIVSLNQAVIERDKQISCLNQAVTEREGQIVSLNQAMAERDEQIARLSQALIERDGQIASLNQAVTERDGHIKSILSTNSWKISRPFRLVKRLIRSIKSKEERHELLNYLAKHLPHKVAFWNQNHPSIDVISVEESEWLVRANSAERIAIIPCAFEFDELVNQRPINAAKYFANQGYFLLFVAWQWTPQDALSKGCSEVWSNVYQVPLYDFISKAEKLSHYNDFSFYMVTMPAPLLVNLIPSLRQRSFAIVYDIMDEWEAFSRVGQAPWFQKSIEDSLILQSDYVCAVSPPLRDKFSSMRFDISVIGNGYTPDVLGEVNKGIAGKQRGNRRIVGYFGHLTDAWFDWNLIFDIAKSRTDITFEIIGYGDPEWARREASALPNIHMLGKILPKELYRYTSRWSAGIIPFVEGLLAEAVDPIKIYEYLYFGAPVIVTGIRHLQDYPMTFFAERENIFEALDSALKYEQSPDELDLFLQKTTWQARFDEMFGQMTKNQNIRLLYAN